MTVATLAVQPASSKTMRTSSPNPTANNQDKSSPTLLTSTPTTTQSPSVPTSASQDQQQTPPLFTPIWDYDRFPIGPCVRESNRSSQEHDNPFLMLEYHQQNHRPQNNARHANSAVMIRSSSSSSSSSTASSHPQQHHLSSSRSSSRHGSRKDLRVSVIGKPSMLNGGISDFSSSSSSPPSPSFAANPTPSSIFPDIHERNHLADSLVHEPSHVKVVTPPSKFDLYKAQMDRIRSSHRVYMHGRSASVASTSMSSPTSGIEGTLSFPSTPSTSVCSPPTSPSTINTPSSSSSASFVPTSNNNKHNSKKSSSQHHGLFPKLFKKPSISKNNGKSRLPTAQPPSATTATPSPTSINSAQGGGSGSSLVYNEQALLSRRGSRSTEYNQSIYQRSPIEEQQERWREEWLRPSGAIHSMFRDGPSKFNCPHCGAMKVVSNIQYVPGLMSYLVAFGLMFLTLGTLSYLPFRKDHEGTKDCIHWCPECERKVARFNRANSTWEWI
ncbi:hypothetical protein FBU30_009969 [Linnemannia zychae]|nr:hypothetical protein FBU30_009969 [Linnemannia zychae]